MHAGGVAESSAPWNDDKDPFEVDSALQGVWKKSHLKEMCDFLTQKMLPLALVLIKTKNCHLFDPLHSGAAVLVFWNPTSLSVKVDEIA